MPPWSRESSWNLVFSSLRTWYKVLSNVKVGETWRKWSRKEVKMEVRDGEANTPRSSQVRSSPEILSPPPHCTIATAFILLQLHYCNFHSCLSPSFPSLKFSIRFSPLHDTHCLLRMSLANASHSTATRTASIAGLQGIFDSLPSSGGVGNSLVCVIMFSLIKGIWRERGTWVCESSSECVSLAVSMLAWRVCESLWSWSRIQDGSVSCQICLPDWEKKMKMQMVVIEAHLESLISPWNARRASKEKASMMRVGGEGSNSGTNKSEYYNQTKWSSRWR